MAKHHPLRKDREIIDEKEIQNILKAGKFATIALSANNVPYIVTLSYGYDPAGNSIYFHAALKGQKLDYINANNQVCATIILDGGYIKGACEHNYASLVLRGEIEVLQDLEEKKHGLYILLNHLEENPEPIVKRNITSDDSYNSFNILRLKIAEVSGKKGK